MTVYILQINLFFRIKLIKSYEIIRNLLASKMPSEKRRKEEKHKELKQSAKSCNKISNFFVAPIPVNDVNENVIENQTTTKVLNEELINESIISPFNTNFNQDNCNVD
jgi:hypothetical protein